jgi:N6-L-threonylcarbamoyladenine synthase|tara:strand:- start:9092 stop:10084 length:993 start_codon:yes stop_codon:yes gene_type:complete
MRKTLSKIAIGIESTAHTAGVGLITSEGKILSNQRALYVPKEGGIHPREAANHHSEKLPDLFKSALEEAGLTPADISLVSYARGPGLGPCLRTGATAARAFAYSHDIPLLGVNHCVAHLEIGLLEGAIDPVLLYLSGANTQVIAYAAGRYRVFGETIDIGIGNGLDKFAREAGMGFPGGPKLEKIAKGDELLDLPYSVKGMDLAFSGLMTAAKQKLDSGHSLSTVAYSIQETAFAMSCEVSERALAHTAKKELVLGGGVACNMRLREMANIMAEERGVKCFVPERSLCVDNGVMIAWLGLQMMKADYNITEKDNVVDQKYRTDMVEVTWR